MADPTPFALPPGVVKMESKGAAKGRFVDCDKVRWVRGRPEKVGGWLRITDTVLTGTVRGMYGWSDGTARQLIAAGTEKKLYAIPLVDFEPIDITPYKTTMVLTDPFETTISTPTVIVTYAAHNAIAGIGVTIAGASAVNGITLDGDYLVASVIDEDHFTLTGGNNASGSGTGGGSVTVSIEIDPGEANPTTLYGYGVGPYGMGTYGTPRAVSSYTIDNRQWFLDAFGKILLANYSGGALYSWDPTTDPAPRASKVTDSPYYPSAMNGFINTSERIVIAWGTNSSSTQDLLEVWTSRQGDYADWDYTGLPTDQGAQPTLSRLGIGKKVVAAGVLGGYVNCIWTDAAFYTKQYTGARFVYSTQLRGQDCGLLGPMAFAIHNGTAYWVSNGAFFQYSGAVSKIPNSEDIAEWIFTQLRSNYNVKAFASVNPRFSEVWFWFVLTGQTEPTIYAVYNYAGQFWFHGTMSRTSITRLAGQNEPIMAASDGYLYEHENGVDANGAEIIWHLESAPFELNNGRWADCLEIEMDMQRQVGNITITLTAYDGTNASASAIDTQEVTAAPTDASVYPRFSGKQVAVKFDGEGVANNFRMGVPKFLIQPGAGR